MARITDHPDMTSAVDYGCINLCVLSFYFFHGHDEAILIIF